MTLHIDRPRWPLLTHWHRGPSLCAVCHAWGTSRLCARCVTRFAAPVTRCQRCAAQVTPGITTCGRCLLAPPHFTSALAAVDYAHPWDRLISEFKYRDGLDLGPALCDLLLAAHQRTHHHHGGEAADWLLPVPLALQRWRERGYNQSWELARRCAPRLGCPADPAVLLRIRDTPHQLSLPREQRQANVRGAFAIEPARRREVAGRHIALIDDVMTTQATADELSRLLLDAGAHSVQVWVVARTPLHPH